MKTLTFIIALIVALLVGTVPASAQTAITATTLSAAITTTSTVGRFTIAVGSATDMAANGVLWVEGSVYRIVSVNGTTITVLNTDFPATHLTSAVVYVMPIGAQYNGPSPTGSCLRSTAGAFPAYSPYTLMFNPSNGEIAACRGNLGSRTWFITTFNRFNPSANPPVTP